MIGGEEEARTGMKVEHGERMGRNSCLLSKGEGKKEKKKEHKARNPLSLFTRRNGNLCRYKGGCFYSCVSIATAPMCSF